MSHQPDEALEVLRAVWSAQGQSSADLGPADGAARSCKRMANVSFDGLAGADGDVEDGDLRAAWRARLAREGKLNTAPGASVADLVRAAAEDRR